ncbi:MAG: hypothetical protein KAT68_12100 [Bacteroidales bacterium]|nr:hypothetical protein [Bacteroidales bacterium]
MTLILKILKTHILLLILLIIISSVANANITKFSNETDNYKTSKKINNKLEINIQYKIPKPYNSHSYISVQSTKKIYYLCEKQTVIKTEQISSYDNNINKTNNRNWIKLFFNKFKNFINILLTRIRS